ncbi:hypothetical protein V2G26_008022 [Clonostachys chloroleuca]
MDFAPHCHATMSRKDDDATTETTPPRLLFHHPAHGSISSSSCHQLSSYTSIVSAFACQMTNYPLLPGTRSTSTARLIPSFHLHPPRRI